MKVLKMLPAKLATIALVFAFFAPPVVSQELKWRFDTDKISGEQWETYLSEVKAKSGARISENWGFTIIDLFSDPEQPAFYTFTKPNHPAHPSVVIRMVVPEGAGSATVSHGHFAGDQAEFDKMWNEFLELTKSYSK